MTREQRGGTEPGTRGLGKVEQDERARTDEGWGEEIAEEIGAEEEDRGAAAAAAEHAKLRRASPEENRSEREIEGILLEDLPADQDNRKSASEPAARQAYPRKRSVARRGGGVWRGETERQKLDEKEGRRDREKKAI